MILDDASIAKTYRPEPEGATLLLGTSDRAGLAGAVLSLSHKDRRSAFRSVTEFVETRDDSEIEKWRAALALGADPDAPFRGQTIAVEDASPDAVLALLALAFRLGGRRLPESWVDYSRRWEQGYTNTTGAPRHSFGALLNALTHADLMEPEGVAEAWRKATAYASGLLALQVNPADLPRMLPTGASAALLQLHDQAHARLAYEEIVYRRLMESGTKLQLAVPMQGSRRRTLVDAIFFSEVMLTSTLKNFLRADCSGFTGQGFALMGLFRPEHAGTGYDMTVSTDPAANLSLHALWRELERMEEERWAEFAGAPEGFPRPRGPAEKNRLLPSHAEAPAPIAPCHQPWYDENGRASLIAAPRFVEHEGKQAPGSRLTWGEVKQAVWRCYAPTLGLRWRGEAESSPIRITDDTAEARRLRRSLCENSDLHFASVVRARGEEDDFVLWTPTLSASCAAFIDTGSSRLENLPLASSFDNIEERGGVVLVTERGAMVIDLTGDGSFPAKDFERAATDVARTVACAADLENEIRETIRARVERATADGDESDRRVALKSIYAAKLRGRRFWDQAVHFETNSLVRRFRDACEQRWQARARFAAALNEIDELERMVVSSSEVRTAAIIDKLAIFGFPISVFGNLLGGLLLFDDKHVFEGFSPIVSAIYLGLVLIGIFLITIYAGQMRTLWRMDRRARSDRND